MLIRPDTASAAYFDTSGRRVRQGVAPHAIGVPATLRAALRIPAQPQAGVRELTLPETATACLELHSGPAVINIQVTADVTSYTHDSPYTILEASFSGDICTGPEATQWQVTDGYIGETFMLLAAERVSPTNAAQEAESVVGSCAQSIIILGIYKNPSSYPGIFGFNGEIFSFSHTTLFKGWQACS